MDDRPYNLIYHSTQHPVCEYGDCPSPSFHKEQKSFTDEKNISNYQFFKLSNYRQKVNLHYLKDNFIPFNTTILNHYLSI